MSNVFILKEAQPYQFALGNLNEPFAMAPLPAFAAHEAMKTAEVERDLACFDSHLATIL